MQTLQNFTIKAQSSVAIAKRNGVLSRSVSCRRQPKTEFYREAFHVGDSRKRSFIAF
ncbi:hypothetical protein PJF56_07970 [Roseofilum sp. BLCC_M91]|uniref:Uncharacterized protein n=1 Tax=Roseofilum halophilum BLCC-M91 TaxID=3022259 RepID=A0ABT7BHY8_9CYAN|nr:hypothetical protein [Roseofilum halophilum]MDJ1178796.1 hypothetical protein [Roseofilum halophilum BLCC-M91]